MPKGVEPDILQYAVTCPPGASSYLDGDGFALGSFWRQYGRSDAVVSADALPDAPCIVLLGEAGVGKSYRFAQFHGAQQLLGGHSLLLPLRRFGPPQSGCASFEALFGHHEIARWSRGDGALYLFLDALEECGFPIERTIDRIETWTESLGALLPRLRLRLSARDAVWSEAYRARLKRIFGDGGVQVWSLLPIDRDHAREALGDDLFARVVQGRLGALASRPLTLPMLREVTLDATSSPLDVFSQGVRLMLCRNLGYDRTVGATQAIQRDLTSLEVLGAQTILGGCHGFEVRPERPIGDGAGVLLDDAEERAMRALGRDEDGVLVWKHQRFAEFFAARWVAKHSADATEALRWLRGREGMLDALPESVAATAGVLASMRDDVRTLLAREAPRVLLRADRSTLPDDLRDALVDDLLAEAERRFAWRFRWGVSLYDLVTPSRHAALRRALRATTDDVRELALELIEASRVTVLLDDVLALACDRDASSSVRRLAVRLIGELGGTERRRTLAALLSSSDATTSDDLRGALLEAVWRDARDTREAVISVEDALAAMGPKLEPSHFGSLDTACFHVIDSLRADEMPAALRWVQRCTTAPGGHDYLESRVLERAWKLAEAPEVCASVVDAILGPGSKFDAFRWDVEQAGAAASRATRERVVCAALDRMTDEELVYHIEKLCTEFSYDWFLQGLLAAPTSARPPWARMLFDVFRGLVQQDPPREDHGELMDTFARLREEHTALRECSRRYFEHGEMLDASLVNLRRTMEAERRAGEAATEKSRLWLHERLSDAVRALDADAPLAWAEVVRYAFGSPARDRWVYGPVGDLRRTTFWQAADATRRVHLVDAAARFLLTNHGAEWAPPPTASDLDDAAFCALLLIVAEDRARLDCLARTAWVRWMPTILEKLTDDEDRTLHSALHSAALVRAEDAYAEAFLQVLDAKVRQGHGLSLLDRAPWATSELLVGRLVAYLADPPGDVRHALAALHRNSRSSEAVDLAEVWWERGDAALRTAAARHLLQHDAKHGWDRVGDALCGDEDLLRAVYEDFDAPGVRWRPTGLALNSLRRLWRALAAAWPYGGPWAMDDGARARDAALEELHRRAEDDAEAYVACTAVAEDPAAPFWSGARLQELAHVRRVREWKPWRTEEIRAGRLPDAYRTPPDPIALLDRLKTLPKASLESVILRVRVDHSILSESPQMQRSIDLLRWAEQDPARVTRLAELVANEGVSPR